MRVLIVDDEESMRALLSALLADRGYEVVAALENGDGITAVIGEKILISSALIISYPGATDWTCFVKYTKRTL